MANKYPELNFLLRLQHFSYLPALQNYSTNHMPRVKRALHSYLPFLVYSSSLDNLLSIHNVNTPTVLLMSANFQYNFLVQ